MIFISKLREGHVRRPTYTHCRLTCVPASLRDPESLLSFGSYPSQGFEGSTLGSDQIPPLGEHAKYLYSITLSDVISVLKDCTHM